MKIFHLLFLVIMMTNHLFANEVISNLDKRMEHTNSLVCVGLDPDLNKMPASILELNMNNEEKALLFLSEVIDITAPHVCCYKIQKAFFDQFENGHLLLNKVCAYIKAHYPDIPAFIDCKIGDIDNTMQAYMHLIFDDLKADGVVINPYMGDDVFEPFLKNSKKTAIVLIQTSNPSATVVQELVLKNEKKLWEEILHLTLTRWNKNNNLILVLSSNTTRQDYIEIRKQIPKEVPILLAGIGAQGGNVEVMQQLLNEDKRGVFVNSSRGILYPYEIKDPNWKEKILNAVIQLKNDLNHIRGK